VRNFDLSFKYQWNLFLVQTPYQVQGKVWKAVDEILSSTISHLPACIQQLNQSIGLALLSISQALSQLFPFSIAFICLMSPFSFLPFLSNFTNAPTNFPLFNHAKT
jgi:hypothetical protein